MQKKFTFFLSTGWHNKFVFVHYCSRAHMVLESVCAFACCACVGVLAFVRGHVYACTVCVSACLSACVRVCVCVCVCLCVYLIVSLSSSCWLGRLFQQKWRGTPPGLARETVHTLHREMKVFSSATESGLRPTANSSDTPCRPMDTSSPGRGTRRQKQLVAVE